MRRTAQRDNTLERGLRSDLHKRGLRFRLHQRVLDDKRRTIDIAFPSGKVAVFVDGCFWHGCPKHGTWPKNNGEWWRAKIEANIARDRDTDKKLIEAGWTVMRVWAHDAVEKVASKIERAVRRSSDQRAKTRP